MDAAKANSSGHSQRPDATKSGGLSRAWTAYAMSLLLPGAGQIWARSWTFLPWLFLAGLSLYGVASMEPSWGSTATAATRTTIFVALGLCSAAHAKRLLEPGSATNPTIWPTTPGNRMSISVDRTRGRRIAARIEVHVARGAADVWNRARDLRRFLLLDPFHESVTLMRNPPAAGVDIAIHHNAYGYRFWRFGRILRWAEDDTAGGGHYSFSDLSAGDRLLGLPHVFYVSVEPHRNNPERCRIVIEVRGKWTSRWIPRRLGHLWVWYVCRQHARLLRNAI